MAVVGGTLDRIKSKLVQDFEFVGEEIAYTAVKEISHLNEESDVDIKNVLKQSFHAFVANGKVYGLRRKRRSCCNLFKCLQSTLRYLEIFKTIIFVLAKLLLPIAIIWLVFQTYTHSTKIFQQEFLISTLVTVFGPTLVVYLWKLLP
jgi:hypothetical protein